MTAQNEFSAITFEFLKKNYFISYRGTDFSLVGCSRVISSNRQDDTAPSKGRYESRESTTNFSVFFDHTLKEFVESLTIAQRREFTKEVFALLSLTETATFNEMLKNPLKNTGTILKSFAGLDSKTRNMLLKTIFAFVKSAKNNFSDITGGQNKITVC